ncbi:MAG: respiratory nitrate reductase subunit gamma [Deltaproteobacteria bacterium]|nr:respiratory nitrate reductase subunit gamma [Deltaproteobacteria bacterium]
MLFFVGCMLPYLAAAVFLIGMTWRTASWLARPVPFALALDPGQCGATRRAATITGELLLLKSLYRGDRRLWLWAGLMHGSLASIILGHVVGIGWAGRQFTVLGISSAASTALSRGLGVVFGLLLLVSVIALLYRRLVVRHVRTLSDPADYFDLALLVAIATTGMLMRLAPFEPDQSAVRTYLYGLLTLSPTAIPGNWIFIGHFALVSILLTYFPFSKLVHVTGGVVSRALVAAPARRSAIGPDARADAASLR